MVSDRDCDINTSKGTEVPGSEVLRSFFPAYDPAKNTSQPTPVLSPGYWFFFYNNTLLLQKEPSALPDPAPTPFTKAGASRIVQEPPSAPETSPNTSPSPALESAPLQVVSPLNLPLLTESLDFSALLPGFFPPRRVFYFGTLHGKPCWATYLNRPEQGNRNLGDLFPIKAALYGYFPTISAR